MPCEEWLYCSLISQLLLQSPLSQTFQSRRVKVLWVSQFQANAYIKNISSCHINVSEVGSKQQNLCKHSGEGGKKKTSTTLQNLSQLPAPPWHLQTPSWTETADLQISGLQVWISLWFMYFIYIYIFNRFVMGLRLLQVNNKWKYVCEKAVAELSGLKNGLSH